MKLLNCDEFCSNLPKVTSDILFIKGRPHPQGLYSEEIFGTTPRDKRERMACIELNCQIIHPLIWNSFVKAFRKGSNIIINLSPYKIINGNIVEVEEEYVDDETLRGIPDLIANIRKLERKSGTYSQNFWTLFDKYQDTWLIRYQPVLPVIARHAKSEFQYDEINDLYIKLIKYSRALSDVEDKKSKKYQDVVTFVQRTVNAIYDYVQAKISKRGLIRTNILGKRVDFSARAVVTGDPNIGIDEVGVPVKIAVKLFEPWIIRELISEGMSLDQSEELVQKLSKGFDIDNKTFRHIIDIIKTVSKDRVVLMKRDPSLHRLSWQAFKPVIVFDDTIHVNPLVVEGFNMDFDGDQAALFHPMSKEAQEEARKLQNPYHPANVRRLKYTFTKDIKAGIYMLTMDPLKDRKIWFWEPASVYGIKTTKGRQALYECIPEQSRDNVNFELFNKPIKDADSVTLKLLELIDVNDVKVFLNHALKLATEAVQLVNASFGIDIIALSDKLQPLLDKYRKSQKIEDKQEILSQISSTIKEEIKNTDLAPLLESGILRFNQLVQMLGVKGIVSDPVTKQPISIDSNFATGLKPSEFFQASYGARTGIISRASKTSITGYMQRKLNFALSSVELNPEIHDCGSRTFLQIRCTEDVFRRIQGRYILLDGQIVKVTKNLLPHVKDKMIQLRSPIFCKSEKLCVTCYGDDYKKLKTTKVGFLAAEALAERLTQNMLKAFHVGGTVKITRIPFIKDISENTRIDEKQLMQFFNESNNQVYAKEKIDLAFDTLEVNLRMLIGGNTQYVDLSMVNFYLIHDKNIEKLAYDGTFRLYGTPNMFIDTIVYQNSSVKVLRIRYDKGDKILDVLPETSDLEEQIKKFKAAFEGRITGRDIHHTLWRLYKRTQSFGNISLVHLEILVSQLNRCKDDLSKPARLCPTWNPVMVSITKIPQLESWIRALQFERFQDSMENALIKDQTSRLSLLDRMIL